MKEKTGNQTGNHVPILDPASQKATIITFDTGGGRLIFNFLARTSATPRIINGGTDVGESRRERHRKIQIDDRNDDGSKNGTIPKFGVSCERHL